MVDVDIGIKIGKGGMDDVLHPTLDADAKLASGKEDASKVGAKHGHENAAGKATVGVANADGTKFGRIGGALVESQTVLGTE